MWNRGKAQMARIMDTLENSNYSLEIPEENIQRGIKINLSGTSPQIRVLDQETQTPNRREMGTSSSPIASTSSGGGVVQNGGSDQNMEMSTSIIAVQNTEGVPVLHPKKRKIYEEALPELDFYGDLITIRDNGKVTQSSQNDHVPTTLENVQSDFEVESAADVDEHALVIDEGAVGHGGAVENGMQIKNEPPPTPEYGLIIDESSLDDDDDIEILFENIVPGIQPQVVPPHEVQIVQPVEIVQPPMAPPQVDNDENNMGQIRPDVPAQELDIRIRPLTQVQVQPQQIQAPSPDLVQYQPKLKTATIQKDSGREDVVWVRQGLSKTHQPEIEIVIPYQLFTVNVSPGVEHPVLLPFFRSNNNLTLTPKAAGNGEIVVPIMQSGGTIHAIQSSASNNVPVSRNEPVPPPVSRDAPNPGQSQNFNQMRNGMDYVRPSGSGQMYPQRMSTFPQMEPPVQQFQAPSTSTQPYDQRGYIQYPRAGAPVPQRTPCGHDCCNQPPQIPMPRFMPPQQAPRYPMPPQQYQGNYSGFGQVSNPGMPPRPQYNMPPQNDSNTYHYQPTTNGVRPMAPYNYDRPPGGNQHSANNWNHQKQFNGLRQSFYSGSPQQHSMMRPPQPPQQVMQQGHCQFGLPQALPRPEMPRPPRDNMQMPAPSSSSAASSVDYQTLGSAIVDSSTHPPTATQASQLDYITPSQLEGRVDAIGNEAAIQELAKFAALITVRNAFQPNQTQRGDIPLGAGHGNVESNLQPTVPGLPPNEVVPPKKKRAPYKRAPKASTSRQVLPAAIGPPPNPIPVLPVPIETNESTVQLRILEAPETGQHQPAIVVNAPVTGSAENGEQRQRSDEIWWPPPPVEVILTEGQGNVNVEGR